MKPSRRLRLSGLSATFGFLLAGVAGCTGSVGGSSGGGATTGSSTGNAGSTGGTGTNPGNAGSTGAAGTSPTGTAGTTGAAGTGGPTCIGQCTCTPGIPATTQLPRMTRVQYDAVINDLLGVTGLSSNNNLPPSALLADDSGGSMTDIAWNGYLQAAERIATQVMASTTTRAPFIACDPATAACLQQTIRTFGRKAFRRPLTDAEVTSFMRFSSLTPAGTANEVAESILYGMLASPSFIMLPELSETAEGSALKLNSHEVATRLSFLFWNSIPDQELNTAADAGMLTTKEQIRAQAVRMLQSTKAAAVARTFHRFYADIQPGTHWVNQTQHDAMKFPSYTAASYTAAMAEMDAFFQEVVLAGGSYKDLFLSNVGFVTRDTASIYGVTSTATTPTKTTLDATKRPGFLTRVGFLSTFSHDATSSPILRGAFISGRILNVPTGTPDPTVLGRQPPPGTYTTERAAMEALTAESPCNSCHTTRINPPGFVLERFNSIGAWQDTDARGGAINSTAEVVLSLAPETKKTVTSPAELMAEIANLPSAQRLYAQQWVAFATGRGPNQNDTCTVDQLAPNLANAGYTIASMMADYTQADTFRLRTLGN